MEMLANILAIVYAVELSAAAFLMGYRARDEKAIILDPYDVAKLSMLNSQAQSGKAESVQWEECYRAALVLKQAGFGMVTLFDNEFAGYAEHGGYRMDSWKLDKTFEAAVESSGSTAEEVADTLQEVFGSVDVSIW